ncbi:shikimate kinase [Caldiplasma sukawensis]
MKIYTNSGISVLSAFATGRGSAVATKMQMCIESTNKIVKETDHISQLISEFTGGDQIHFRVIQEIPQMQGLKSSSAIVGGALMLNILTNNIEIKMDDILKIGSEISIKLGLSATGATDDLAASLLGGLTICDNKERKLIKRLDVPPLYAIIISFSGEISSKKFGDNDFSTIRDLFPDPYEINEKNFLEIAVKNGFLLSKISGFKIPENIVKNSSANYLGINGRGPSLFLIYDDSGKMENDHRLFLKMGFTVYKTILNNRGFEWLP